jgi:hypothetical protein
VTFLVRSGWDGLVSGSSTTFGVLGGPPGYFYEQLAGEWTIFPNLNMAFFTMNGVISAIFFLSCSWIG